MKKIKICIPITVNAENPSNNKVDLFSLYFETNLKMNMELPWHVRCFSYLEIYFVEFLHNLYFSSFTFYNIRKNTINLLYDHVLLLGEEKKLDFPR